MTPESHPCGRVLVVDDDLDILESMSFFLASAGYDTVTASNGAEALERLRGSATPCLILLDLMMPVMNAWEFRVEQKRDPALASIPVVAMTGFRGAPHIGSLGVSTLLEKPIDLDMLLTTIARYCR